MNSRFRQLAAIAMIAAVASCGSGGGFDPDLRRWIPGGMDTGSGTAAPRPQPDSRGLISFPDYQVAVAQQDDTVAAVAARIGLPAAELAQYNALPPTARLQRGAVLVLPRRVQASAPAAAGGGRVAGPFAGPQAAGGSPAAAPGATPAQPRQHEVATGETAWSIARRYGVSVQDLAAWNGLPQNMAVRVGQRLLIPVSGQSAPNPAAVTTPPGSGSPTPRPPSAAAPLPEENTVPAAAPVPDAPTNDMGAQRTAASSGGKFRLPVNGSIIRVYEKGRNDGIDIAAPAGVTVQAAGAGTVAAITKDTAGVPIVVVRHEGNLMTVYTGMSGLEVAKGDRVTAGQSIGKAGNAGFVHFEVRQGFESVDPETYIR